jgi:ribonuclease HI
MARAVVLVFDGGSKGNPGPAFGSYRLQRPGTPPQAPKRLDFGHGTNNEAEYKALIAGLDDLLRQLDSESQAPGEIALEVRGDSQLILKQVRGEWKTKKPQLQRLRQQALARLQQFASVQYIHHDRRHSVRILGH